MRVKTLRSAGPGSCISPSTPPSSVPGEECCQPQCLFWPGFQFLNIFRKLYKLKKKKKVAMNSPEGQTKKGIQLKAKIFLKMLKFITETIRLC